MEKLNFVRNGVVTLPPGFRFHPTDEELVAQYLRRKVFSCPLPASIIPDVAVLKFDPWDLPGYSRRERYFFSTREAKYPNGNRANRATGSGYWKATGSDKDIVASRTNQIVGKKKVLAFYRGKAPKGLRTDWVMHEYRLSDEGARGGLFLHTKNSTNNSVIPVQDWVLCRVFLKKRSNQDDRHISRQVNENRGKKIEMTGTGFIDFMNQETNSSDSETSVLTEVSSTETPFEETSSFNRTSSSSSE